MVAAALKAKTAETRVLVPTQSAQRKLWITAKVGRFSSTGIATAVRNHAHHRIAGALSGTEPNVLLCGEVRHDSLPTFARGIGDERVRTSTEQKWSAIRKDIAAAKENPAKNELLKRAVADMRNYVEYLATIAHVQSDLTKALAAIAGSNVDTATEAQLRAAAKELKVQAFDKMKDVSVLRSAVKVARDKRRSFGSLSSKRCSRRGVRGLFPPPKRWRWGRWVKSASAPRRGRFC
jgi:hypothetical protein